MGGESAKGSAGDPVLGALTRIDRLRQEGRGPGDIAAILARDGVEVPGGGDWTRSTVVRILEVFDLVRAESATGADPASDPSLVESVAGGAGGRPLPGRRPPPVRPPSELADLEDGAAGNGAGRAEPGEPPEAVESSPDPDPEPAPDPDPDPVTDLTPVPGDAAASDDPADGGRSSRRRVLRAARFALACVAIACLGAAGFLAIRALVDRAGSDQLSVTGTSTTVPSSGTASPSSSEPATTTTSPDPADTLAIRIETETDPAPVDPNGLVAATATIRSDGKLYLEGAFADRAQVDAFLEQAGPIFGAENIVESYVIDPAAPAPSVADVVLDKPVLFQSGTADIHPDYIPFLEACAGVLALNPHIVMSISAHTDSSGDASVNLALSQQRAQAIVDFYRARDIGDDQLLGRGFGEAEPIADNGTEAGRRENRRAMLQLLNVMGADTADE